MALCQRELCRYFIRGNCRYGANCFYSHEINDLNNKLIKLPKVCQYFLQGTCIYGDQCRYEHIKEIDEEQVKQIEIENVNNLEIQINKPENVPSTINSNELCPYFEKDGVCVFDYECGYIHGDICDSCNKPCLNPYDENQRNKHRSDCLKQLEDDMNEAFAIQRSENKQCGICMEVVWEKEINSDRRFGILENCNHIYCLPCIRKWRASNSYEKKIVKACPECRVKSDYVTPSRYWFEDENEKTKIIQDYKVKLGETPCKYFKQGNGQCPFGNKCFYRHQYPDGTNAVLSSPVQRRRFNKDGELEAFADLIQVDLDYSDDEDPDFDVLEFLRNNLLIERINTDEEYADFSLFELLYDYLID